MRPWQRGRAGRVGCQTSGSVRRRRGDNGFACPQQCFGTIPVFFRRAIRLTALKPELVSQFGGRVIAGLEPGYGVHTRGSLLRQYIFMGWLLRHNVRDAPKPKWIY